MKIPETGFAVFEKPTEDYLRVMTASPEMCVGDPAANLTAIEKAYQEAKEAQAELIVLPELCVTGYSSGDLFFNRHVLDRSVKALQDLAKLTKNGPALAVGAPIEQDGILYNCGILLAEGSIRGAVPKSYLPNYNEFYEKRWFTSGKGIQNQLINIGSEVIPFGTDVLFDINGTTVGVEICEDAWAPITPGTYAALAGAEVIVNLSASNELIGKAEYRRDMIANLAAKLVCAYIYTSAGEGESTADVAYGGHQMIAENGRILAEVKPFQSGNLVIDIDRSELIADRLVNKTYADQAADSRLERKFRTVGINVPRPLDPVLLREIDAHPFVPSDPEKLDKRCGQLFEIMARSLARRAKESDAKGFVIGLSGGLDSTLSLLSALYACDVLGKSNDFIHTLTMPGPASSNRTQDNAGNLARALGTTHKTIPIGGLTKTFLESIGHSLAAEDTTYENVQARIRTGLLMNYGNNTGSFVVGTGDMSENAQGWCTYNGDHMSMFNPNTSIPKTLVRHLVRWFAESRVDGEARDILLDILDTPVSPELTGNGDLSQSTDSILGPDDLRDFFLYHQNRRHEAPSKTGFLAVKAFEGRYGQTEVAHWLDSYLRRYTASQWKRDVMPNGPKAGTVSLSPRGDLRLPPNLSPSWYK